MFRPELAARNRCDWLFRPALSKKGRNMKRITAEQSVLLARLKRAGCPTLEQQYQTYPFQMRKLPSPYGSDFLPFEGGLGCLARVEITARQRINIYRVALRIRLALRVPEMTGQSWSLPALCSDHKDHYCYHFSASERVSIPSKEALHSRITRKNPACFLPGDSITQYVMAVLRPGLQLQDADTALLSVGLQDRFGELYWFPLELTYKPVKAAHDQTP